MLIAVAVIAPVWSAGPRAVTHWPTARAEALAVEVCEYVVLEPVVMPTDRVGGVVVVVVDLPEELDGRRNVPPLRSTPSTVKPVDDT